MEIKVFLIIVAAITIWTDGRYRLIYDKVLLPAFVLAILFNTIQWGWHGLTLSVTGAAAGYAILYLLYRFADMGGGDLKLLATYGAMLGPWLVFNGFIYGGILGGVFGLYCILKKEKTCAYGIPLSIGAILAVMFPWPMIK